MVYYIAVPPLLPGSILQLFIEPWFLAKRGKNGLLYSRNRCLLLFNIGYKCVTMTLVSPPLQFNNGLLYSRNDTLPYWW